MGVHSFRIGLLAFIQKFSAMLIFYSNFKVEALHPDQAAMVAISVINAEVWDF